MRTTYELQREEPRLVSIYDYQCGAVSSRTVIDPSSSFRYTSVPINDSIWLAGGSLAVGAGNQIYLFSRFLDRGSPAPSPSASVKSVTLDSIEPEDLFQLIAWQNGPLLDYHPTVLAQCLIWGMSDFVIV